MIATIKALNKIAAFSLSIYRSRTLHACTNKGRIHMKRYYMKRKRILLFQKLNLSFVNKTEYNDIAVSTILKLDEHFTITFPVSHKIKKS